MKDPRLEVHIITEESSKLNTKDVLKFVNDSIDKLNMSPQTVYFAKAVAGMIAENFPKYLGSVIANSNSPLEAIEKAAFINSQEHQTEVLYTTAMYVILACVKVEGYVLPNDLLNDKK